MVQVWGIISWKGPGRLVRIDGNLNADGYIALLEEHLLASFDEMGLERPIFQQVVHFNSVSIIFLHFTHDTLGWCSLPYCQEGYGLVQGEWHQCDGMACPVTGSESDR